MLTQLLCVAACRWTNEAKPVDKYRKGIITSSGYNTSDAAPAACTKGLCVQSGSGLLLDMLLCGNSVATKLAWVLITQLRTALLADGTVWNVCGLAQQVWVLSVAAKPVRRCCFRHCV